MNAKIRVAITERVNITKHVFINLHYLRLKKIDGGHINFLDPWVMYINKNILSNIHPFGNGDPHHLMDYTLHNLGL